MLYTPVINTKTSDHLISLEEAKKWLELGSYDDQGNYVVSAHQHDTWIQTLISSAASLVENETGRMTRLVTGCIIEDCLPSVVPLGRKRIKSCVIDYYNSDNTKVQVTKSNVTVIPKATFDEIIIPSLVLYDRPDAIKLTVELQLDVEHEEVMRLAMQKCIADWYENRENNPQKLPTVVSSILRPIRIWGH
jgi:hypothetical protein